MTGVSLAELPYPVENSAVPPFANRMPVLKLLLGSGRRGAFVACLWLGVALGAAPDFTRDIRPIFDKRCGNCHSRLQQKGGLRLDAGLLVLQGGKKGAVITPGQPAASRLLARVTSAMDDERMPPEGAPLDPEQISLLTTWVQAGAPIPPQEVIPSSPADHWAFQPVQNPAPPVVRDAAWPRNAVDRFLLSGLEARGLSGARDASPAALLRRVTLDLIGLPPTPAEQQAFARLIEAEPATALDRVIDGLLARPEYGERWARHWLDLARYADSNGYERDAAKPLVWQYRDYVIRSLNADKPYDRFVREQLAGDELPDASAETVIATGFLRLGHWDDEPADVAADRFDQLDDLVRTTSEAFLGLTLGCARCHDHKFEPLSTRDYYSLVAVFAPLQRPQNGRTELTLPAGSPSELATLAARDRELERLNRESATALNQFRDEYLRSGRSSLPAATLDAWRAAAERRTEAQKKLVTESQAALEKQLEAARPEGLRQQLASGELRKKQLREATPDLSAGYFLHEPPGVAVPPTHVLMRGNPQRPGDAVTPAAPAILHPPALSPSPGAGRTSGRRLAFAKWLTAPENPLFARVLVNRVWQQHFGTGLVRTPGDFGLMGEPPTHPELLDWLAHWFVHDAHGSIKQLHRLLLGSHAWRMGRQQPAGALEMDPENRLWSYLPYRRLEVEPIRDSMLAASGRISLRKFGPPMFPDIPAAALEANTDKSSIWTPSTVGEQSRRTIYAFIKRGLVVPMLEVLDLCDTVQSSPRRQTTTVAPQALTLFNGSFVNAQAAQLAERLRREAGPDPDARLDLAYRLTVARLPHPAERQSHREFLKQETAAQLAEKPGTDPQAAGERAWIQLARVVLNLNEFVYPD